MSTPEHLPLLVKGLIKPGECAALRNIIDRAPGVWAETSQEGSSGFEVDLTRRRVRLALLPERLTASLQSRLRDVMPSLARLFDVELRTLEGPQFLRYSTGHFYSPHRDAISTRESRGVTRKLTLVLQLSDQLCRPILAPRPGAYCGGELQVRVGVDYQAFPGRCGEALVFPASTLHAVTPVTAGVRHTVVVWYV